MSGNQVSQESVGSIGQNQMSDCQDERIKRPMNAFMVWSRFDLSVESLNNKLFTKFKTIILELKEKS